MTTKTSARWDNNRLMVRWYGADSEDEAAWFFPNTDGHYANPRKEQPFVLVFEGYEDTFTKFYYEKPTAEEALACILQWQLA